MNPSRPNLSPSGFRVAARGFTLIELLTVVAIIGVLAAILIPTVGAVRAQARVSNSTSNLKQILVAAQMHAAENRGLLPGALYKATPGTKPGPQWAAQLLPYVGLQGDQTWHANRSKVFVDPVLESIAGTPLQSWRGGYGMNTRMIFANGSAFRGDVDDNSYMQPMSRYLSPGRTVMVAFHGLEAFTPNETTGLIPTASTFYLPESGPAPTGITADAQKRIGAGSDGSGGHSALYGFLDGSVRKLTPTEASEFLKRRQ